MNAYTVTAKGQITLRKELLQHLGVHPGEKISIARFSPRPPRTPQSTLRPPSSSMPCLRSA
jgi:bifunctional DNA-binding transcriptional regulator/antitoxin component of YhaV-PrlF toxin-antitoxin module